MTDPNEKPVPAVGASIPKRALNLLRDAYSEWDKHNASSLAAALSYYAAFATAPTLVLLVGLLGFVLGRGTVRAEVLAQARVAMGPQGESVAAMLLDNAAHPGASLIAGAISVVTLLVSTTGLFAELSRSLDIVWDVPTPKKFSIVRLLKERALAFLMVLAGGAFLILTMLASTILTAMGERLDRLGWLTHVAITGGNLLVAFLGVAGLFAIAFKTLPRAHVAWREVIVGALFTTVLFTLGKVLIGLYFAKSAMASSFGAAGSFAVYLAWVYYTTQIFFFGAELTQVYARGRGDRIVPVEGEGADEGVAPRPPREGDPKRPDPPDPARPRTSVA